MEVCADSVISAVNAEKGGAARIELCGNLFEGGTTPSIGMLKIIKQHVQIPVYVMIRSRGGDFHYTDEEIEVMCADIEHLKQAGADGFVFGALTQDGQVDKAKCGQILDCARPKPCTFHRAIDVTSDISVGLEMVISLGFERVLTSGGESSALEGLPTIAALVKQAKRRISVMPGGGITERNLHRILEGSGAHEFHGTARSSVTSKMTFRKDGVPMGAALTSPEFSVKFTDSNKVASMISAAKHVLGTGE